jgi:uncharacterized protein YeaC (DUF1315 family)
MRQDGVKKKQEQKEQCLEGVTVRHAQLLTNKSLPRLHFQDLIGENRS